MHVYVITFQGFLRFLKFFFHIFTFLNKISNLFQGRIELGLDLIRFFSLRHFKFIFFPLQSLTLLMNTFKG